MTLLSILGLNASPLKRVIRFGCPSYFEERYSVIAVTKRDAPPTGSCSLE